MSVCDNTRRESDAKIHLVNLLESIKKKSNKRYMVVEAEISSSALVDRMIVVEQR